MSRVEFIQKAFNTIKNEFDLLKVIPINLEIVTMNDDTFQDMEPLDLGYMTFSISNKGKIEDLSIRIVENILESREYIPDIYDEIAGRDKLFFQSLGIELNDESLAVTILLHEFGHIYNMMEFAKFCNPRTLESYRDVSSEFLSSILLYTYQGNMTEAQWHMMYNKNMPGEAYADVFKFKYFMLIWNKIKMK